MMAGLQAAVLAVALVGGTFLAARLAATVVPSTTVVRDRRRYVVVRSLFVGAGGLGAGLLYALDPAGVHAASTGPNGSAAVALEALALAALVLGAGYAALRGLAPFRPAARERGVVAPNRERRLYRHGVAGAGAIGLSAAAAALRSDRFAGDEWLLVPAAALVVLGLAAAIRDPVEWETVREPSEGERDLIERCYERFDATPRRVHVFEAAPGERVPLAVGLFGTAIWIEAGVIEDVPEDQLAGALAHCHHRARGGPQLRWLGRAVAVAGAAGVAWTALDGTLLWRGVGIGSATVGGVAAASLGLTLRERRADVVARDHLGFEAVRAAYESLTPAIDAEGSTVAERLDALDPERALEIRFRRRYARARLVAAAPVVLLGAAIWVDAVPVGAFWLLPTAVASWAAFQYYVYPFSPIRGETIREPTDAEVERVRAAYDRFDRDPDRVVVVGGDAGTVGAARLGRASEANAVAVARRGDERWVWIHERLFEAASDDDLATALAQADEAGRLDHYRLARCNLQSLLLVPTLLLFALRYPGSPYAVYAVLLVPLVLIGHLVASWRLRQRIYRADDFAVDHLGADVVAAAYRRLGSSIESFLANEASGSARRLTRAITQAPDVRRRLGRLDRRRAGGDGPDAAARADDAGGD